MLVQLLAALWSMVDAVTPKKRIPPTPQLASAGSREIQSGVPSTPFALNCHPFTVIWLLFSTSIAPLAFLLIVPAALLMPGPLGLEPPPSSVTLLEFST